MALLLGIKLDLLLKAFTNSRVLIITGSNPSLVDTIIGQLDCTFSTKDLRPLSYFCGVEVLATSSGLLLSQQKYVIDLLSKHNMLDSKHVSTPLSMGTSMTANDGIESVMISAQKVLF